MSKKIRVLHAYNVMNVGGAETFIMNVFRNIDREKIEFNFLCLGKQKGKYDNEIIDLGGNIYHLENFNKNNLIFAYFKILHFLKETGPYDVVHLPIQFYSGIFCLAANKAKIKKIIVHSHSASDSAPSSFLRNQYKNLMRFLINKYSTRKLSCGIEAGKFLFGENQQFEVIYNGIDIDKYRNIDRGVIKSLKEKYKIRDELIIGHVGRFSKVKNHQFFIGLCKQLLKQNIVFKIMLVGAGDEYETFIKKVHENHLEKYFIFTGLQKNPELFYQLFDVFVMPSLYEGFPVSIIEAIASGKCCVASDTISKEVSIIPDSCIFLNLNDDLNNWIDKIIIQSHKKIDKKEIDKLEDSDFNIKNTIKEIEKIYLS